MNGGSWQVAMTLPSTVVLNTSNYVSIDLETGRPYLYHEEHKVKYKGQGHSNGRCQGKGHWKHKD